MSATAPGDETRELVVAGAAVGVAALLFVGLAGRTTDSTLFAFVGRFHPLAVHLPVGMILLVAALEALSFNHRVRPRIDPVVGIVLRLTLASAVVAFALGSVLGSTGEYPPYLLRLHRWLTFATVIAAAASAAVWSFCVAGRAPRLMYRGALLGTLLLLGVGAHFGGSLTHGGDYLLAYAPSFLKGPAQSKDVAAKPARAVVEPLVWGDLVLPILQSRCASCHGAESAKGRLRVDSIEALLGGGKSGPAVVVGDSDASLLLRRVRSSLSDDEHMPPEDKEQPTSAEVELIALWIDRGASAETRARELLIPEGARGLLADAVRRAGAPQPLAAPQRQPSAATVTASTTAPSAKPAPAPANQGAGAAASFATVAPILAAKCGRCHGASKRKGELRTDSLAALLAGGASGPAIVEGSPGQGTLLARLRLPVGDDDHMPPRDSAQLEADELEAISKWILGGAAGPRLVAVATPAAPPAGAHASVEAASLPEPPRSAATSIALFDQVVKPLLERRCGRCHSPIRPAGGFALMPPEALLAEGYVVAGRPDASLLYSRVALPHDDADHMPPSSAPQPSLEEVAALRLWIERGAGEGRVDVNEVAPSLIAAASQTSQPAGKTDAGETAGSRPAEDPRGELMPMRVRGGCAGCATGATAYDDRWAEAAALMLALCAISRRRRSRAA